MWKAALLLAVGVALAAVGCGGATDGAPASTPPARAQDETAERTAEAYAAAVRREVRGGPFARFERAFVLDGVVEEPGDPLYQFDVVREPFPTVVKRKIARALADLAPLEFVSDLEGLTGGRQECRVKRAGILVGLGPIRGDGTVTDNTAFFACLRGRLIVLPIGDLDSTHAFPRPLGDRSR
jgi:hypothetical protein